jgi:hypothetical protein
LNAGDNDLSWDAGLTPPTASLGNYVWEDLDLDGQQDSGEPGVPNVLVTLQVPGGGITTTTTGPTGYYTFTNLISGTYRITFTAPSGYTFTLVNTGGEPTDSDADPSTGGAGPLPLNAGDNDLTWDAGLWRPAQLGDFVWSDDNRDGVQDPGEGGIPGVTVTLQLPGGGISTTTTNASGFYSFTNLISGTYRITFTAPSGYVFSPQDASGDTSDSDADPGTGATPPFPLNFGDSDQTWDAGLWAPVSLGNFVWFDMDQDGVQDGGEMGVADVLVTLQTPTTTLTTTTDANGIYSFTNLISGTYSLTFTAPAGFSITLRNASGNAVDSDADPTTGETGPFQLFTGFNDLTWDVGIHEAQTVIELIAFTATANGNGSVTLAWETATEIDTAGFNLYRSASPNGPYVQVNGLLIGAQGAFGGGASYTYADDPGTGTWYYRLVDVDTSGRETTHGPASVTVGGQTQTQYRLWLPIIGN